MEHAEMYNVEENLVPHITTKDWVVTLLLTCVPFVGFILLIMWAFGSNTQSPKRTFARGYLIVQAILITIVVLVYVIIFAIFFSLLASF